MAAFTGWSNEGAQTLSNSLSQLGQTYGKAIETQGHRQLMSDLGTKLAANDINGAMQIGSALGNPDMMLKLHQMQLNAEGDKNALAVINGGQPTGPAAPAAAPANVSTLGNFGASANRVLGFEGADGKVTTDNNGAIVKFGVNAASHPGLDVANLTKGQALQIYKKEYWDALGLDAIAQQNPALAHAAFDTAINAGPGKAKELLAASGGDANKLLDLRQQFNQTLINSDPNGKYGPAVQKAWSDRIAALRNDIGGGQPTGQPNGVNGSGDMAQKKAQLANLERALLTPNISEGRKENINAAINALKSQIGYDYEDQKLPGAQINAQVQARMAEGQKLGLTGPALQKYALEGKLGNPTEDMTPAQKKMSEGYADKQMALEKDANSAGASLASLNTMEKLLADPNFISGTGANNMARVKSLAAALGFGDKNVTSANEVFRALSGKLVLAANGGTLGAGVSNSDVEFLQRLNPNEALSPEANARLIKIAKADAQSKIDINKMAVKYAKSHGGVIDGDFQAMVDDYRAKANQAEEPKKTDQPKNLTPPSADDLNTARQKIKEGFPRDQIVKFLEANGHSAEGL